MTDAPPSPRYETVAQSAESTVVAEYISDEAKQSAYQSEAVLEQAFIDLLRGQAYEYLPITSEDALIANLRAQLEGLNNVVFSDAEWTQFFRTAISGERDGIVDKTRRIQEDHVQLLTRDDGTTKNIRLIDKQNIHNNRLQVINQYEVTGSQDNRYDVTVLVNGLPLVHIELKRRGVEIRQAFNQIRRYDRESFWAGSGLFEYVQLFVISNGTHTKYYSNTTRHQHVAEANGSTRTKKTSNTFEFTSWWADAANRPIADLMAFGKTFFAKHSLLNVLTKYCVFTEERTLLVMRPYQIVAAERILQRIAVATTYKKYGTIEGGGYIWHTTGSGKTLTSFKSAQLATRIVGIDKVLFVVDRKDLDYQTMREYDRFQKGAANSNASTAILRQQLENPSARIIITTIQKLSNFVAANKGHAIYGQNVVIIFDECHRSQFGDMHEDITKAFKKYYLFGFTGTPIFAANSGSGGNPTLKTTEQAFGEKLHTYTIVDAISDKNVLPFRIDYINTIKTLPSLTDAQVRAIDTEKALLAPERIGAVVRYIREHFGQKTKRNEVFALGDRRVRGFNSLLATASIEAAKKYYNEFGRQQKDLPEAQQLKVATIFSFAPNEEDPAADGLLPEEEFETARLDLTSRDFLGGAVLDYNAMFGMNFDTSSEGFQSYYKDIAKRLKNRELDLVIVVNMFLTGFDATTLNTLWVDKNLRQHGLVQAYSRTNRILNSVKTYGNIVTFRDLETETNEAIALFGNKEAGGLVLLRPYGEYYAEYADKVSELLASFPVGEQIVGEKNQKDFIRLFSAILRLRNILTAFDDFAGNEILTDRQRQDYQSMYLDLRDQFVRDDDADKESINEDVVFEIELIKQVEINVDYILMLVRQHQESKAGGSEDREILATIDRAVAASFSLRSKRDLIAEFVSRLSVTADVDAEWAAFVARKRAEELDLIIAEESLDAEATRAFVEAAFRDGAVVSTGMAITKVLPPVTRFSAGGGRAEKKAGVLEKLSAYVERFLGLG